VHGPHVPFLDLPNVIGSPHNSAGGGAWRDEYLRRAVQNCRRDILGETPWNLIGPDERMLYYGGPTLQSRSLKEGLFA
jgi:phosphoglycerate dehydrogenase-like enzyme